MWGLIYKMLRRNHPKFDLTRVRVSFRCEIYESQMILNLRAIDWFQLSAL